jgi:pyruvate/2-oxoglutarate dehydrogenase complex dihydrolipoamide acyltransferase (E2) component
MYNSWEVTTFLALIIYAYLYKIQLLFIFIGIFVLYHILGEFFTREAISKFPGFKPTAEQNIRMASNDVPRDGNCLSLYEIDID